MGTKLQYAINLLASKGFVANCVDIDWDAYCFRDQGLKEKVKRTCLDTFRDSMDRRVLKNHGIESIKRTMLMQEDTFKHQVQELHRLYKVQKRLMLELKGETKQKGLQTPSTASDISHSGFINQIHPPTQPITDFTLQVRSVIRDDPSSREPSGSCSEDTLRAPKLGFDLERPAEEDIISTRVSATDEEQLAGTSSERPQKYNNKAGSSAGVFDEESDVELTLSIGGSMMKKVSKTPHYSSLELGCSDSTHTEIIRQIGSSSSSSLKADGGENCSEAPNTMSGSSTATAFDQERQRPHWLFQGLSLNRT